MEDACPWLIIALVAASLATIVGVCIEPRWRYTVHRWEVADEEIYEAPDINAGETIQFASQAAPELLPFITKE